MGLSPQMQMLIALLALFAVVSAERIRSMSVLPAFGSTHSKRQLDQCADPSLEVCTQTLDMCCPSGYTCCELNGEGVGCAPPGGQCCETGNVHACAEEQECCGTSCMPAGSVCCESAEEGVPSSYCPASYQCSTDNNFCESEGAASLMALSCVAAFFAFIHSM